MITETGGELGITEDGKAVWVAKKPQTYCRWHGKRIRGWFGSCPMCDDCITEFRGACPPPEFVEEEPLDGKEES